MRVSPAQVAVLERMGRPVDAVRPSVTLITPSKCASTTILKGILRHQGRYLRAGVAVHDAPAFARVDGTTGALADVIVGVCRHPVHRAISFWRRGKCPFADSWAAFVEWVCGTEDTAETDVHIRAQTFDLERCGRPPDALLRVESLPRDWAALERLFGWPHVELGREKESVRPEPTVTADQRAALCRRYGRDLEALNYA